MGKVRFATARRSIAGLRREMVEIGAERPDLAAAVRKNMDGDRRGKTELRMRTKRRDKTRAHIGRNGVVVVEEEKKRTAGDACARVAGGESEPNASCRTVPVSSGEWSSTTMHSRSTPSLARTDATHFFTIGARLNVGMITESMGVGSVMVNRIPAVAAGSRRIPVREEAEEARPRRGRRRRRGAQKRRRGRRGGRRGRP